MADQSEVCEHIHVKVCQEREQPTRYKIKKFMPLQKLFNAYSERLGIQRSSVRFYFDGVLIKDQETPAMLEMEEDDLIDVQVETIGGGES